MTPLYTSAVAEVLEAGVVDVDETDGDREPDGVRLLSRRKRSNGDARNSSSPGVSGDFRFLVAAPRVLNV